MSSHHERDLATGTHQMLELAILGVLKERAVHGYELRKQLVQRLGFFWTVSFGSLYPTLRRLEKRGAIEKVRSTDPGTRRKQAYRITRDGEQQFLALLEEGTSSAWEEDKFPLRLAFFRYLRPDMRLRLLERRRGYLEDRLDEGQRSLTRAKRGDRLDIYTLSLMRHGVDVTEHDIRWLDELIAAERAALAEASHPPPHEQSPQQRGSSETPPASSGPEAHDVGAGVSPQSTNQEERTAQAARDA
jgi:DNA-binding PadR family transcriptional regulator